MESDQAKEFVPSDQNISRITFYQDRSLILRIGKLLTKTINQSSLALLLTRHTIIDLNFWMNLKAWLEVSFAKMLLQFQQKILMAFMKKLKREIKEIENENIQKKKSKKREQRESERRPHFPHNWLFPSCWKPQHHEPLFGSKLLFQLPTSTEQESSCQPIPHHPTSHHRFLLGTPFHLHSHDQ